MGDSMGLDNSRAAATERQGPQATSRQPAATREPCHVEAIPSDTRRPWSAGDVACLVMADSAGGKLVPAWRSAVVVARLSSRQRPTCHVRIKGNSPSEVDSLAREVPEAALFPPGGNLLEALSRLEPTELARVSDLQLDYSNLPACRGGAVAPGLTPGPMMLASGEPTPYRMSTAAAHGHILMPMMPYRMAGATDSSGSAALALSMAPSLLPAPFMQRPDSAQMLAQQQSFLAAMQCLQSQQASQREQLQHRQHYRHPHEGCESPPSPPASSRSSMEDESMMPEMGSPGGMLPKSQMEVMLHQLGVPPKMLLQRGWLQQPPAPPPGRPPSSMEKPPLPHLSHQARALIPVVPMER